MQADVEVANITRPVPIIINRLQQLERMVVDVSEASETRVGDEWHRPAHHHPKHIPCWSEGASEDHQPFSHSFYRRYDSYNILHPLHARLERRGRLLVDILQTIFFFVQNGVVSVDCKVQEDVEEQVRRGTCCEGGQPSCPDPSVHRTD